MFNFNEELTKILPTLMPYALKMSKNNRQDADDLIQTTMLKVINRQDSLKNYDNFAGWVYVVMKNTFLTKLTVDGKHQYVELEVNSDNIKENSTYNHYDYNYLVNLINTLPEIYKVPFSLYKDGYKYCEISEKLNINIDTIKSRISRARIKLKNKIK